MVCCLWNGQLRGEQGRQQRFSSSSDHNSRPPPLLFTSTTFAHTLTNSWAASSSFELKGSYCPFLHFFLFTLLQWRTNASRFLWMKMIMNEWKFHSLSEWQWQSSFFIVECDSVQASRLKVMVCSASKSRSVHLHDLPLLCTCRTECCRWDDGWWYCHSTLLIQTLQCSPAETLCRGTSGLLNFLSSSSSSCSMMILADDSNKHRTSKYV